MTPLGSEAFASQDVVRPAAVLSESAAKLILAGLADDDVHAGGHWWTRVGTWRRFETPWAPGAREPDDAFRHAGLTLQDCPRAQLEAPPRPFSSLMRDGGPPR